jgi:osmotically-inducible protein OsmY
MMRSMRAGGMSVARCRLRKIPSGAMTMAQQHARARDEIGTDLGSGQGGGVMTELARELGLTRPTGPKGYRRSDERMREDVCERLWHEQDLDVSNVEVESHDGTILLRGGVPERRMKHRIEDIAAECAGVKDVDNRLRVAPFERAPADLGNI